METPETVRPIHQSDLETLKPGQCLDRLQSIIGLPREVERRGEGFDLLVSLIGSGATAKARLRFDRAGCLVEWKAAE